jgi:hypothetical protein
MEWERPGLAGREQANKLHNGMTDTPLYCEASKSLLMMTK